MRTRIALDMIGINYRHVADFTRDATQPPVS